LRDAFQPFGLLFHNLPGQINAQIPAQTALPIAGNLFAVIRFKLRVQRRFALRDFGGGCQEKLGLPVSVLGVMG
jgi:hypothetical protein